MRKALFYCIVILLTLNDSSVLSQDSTSTGFGSTATIPYKMLSAKMEFQQNNMRGALTLYREILEADPSNATATLGIAQCHYNLKKYNLALEYLNRALAINTEVNPRTSFFFGQIYHRLADLDKAINYYQQYIDAEKMSTYEKELALKYIKECQFAKSMMANPAPVVISNMGEVVNSRFEEYAPGITSDGKTIYFTSRRSDTKGGNIDQKGDYKFFEDIYSSTYNPETEAWSDSEPIPGAVNTETYDGILSIAPDGMSMFVYKNTTNSAGDIFFSKKSQSDGEWYAAEKLSRPINTTYFESSVSITADGSTLYFISERPEGMGQGDIYVATKKGDSWSNPKNLGKVINTEDDEKFVFIHPNGKTLYFSSNGHECLGSYDIFKTEFVNGEWSIPVNLGYPINTVNEESTFSLTADNKKLFLAAEYKENFGERDIYMVDVSQYDLISKGYENGTFGQIICIALDAGEQEIRGVEVKVFDAVSGKLMGEGKTDKTGRWKLSLQGNRSYRVEFIDGVKRDERIVDLTLKAQGETVEKATGVLR